MPITIIDGTGSSQNAAVVNDSGQLAVQNVGSVAITNGATIGSLAVQTVLGSVNIDNASAIGSLGTQTVIGSVNISNAVTVGSLSVQTITGSVSQTTSPWTVAYQKGTYGYSGATLISGTAINIFTPGTGSSVELKAFSLSAEAANKVSIIFSGGNAIGTWMIPASGAVMMNLIGAEPSGAANQPLAVKIFGGGSVSVSVFARSLI